jgi:hypothetical protein
MSQAYGVRIPTIETAILQVSGDLDYLCSLIEQPDQNFAIKDALIYCRAVSLLTEQLDLAERISGNEIDQDGEYFKVSEKELHLMGRITDDVDDALLDLEEICGISIRKN